MYRVRKAVKLRYSDIPAGGRHIVFRDEGARWEGLRDFRVERAPCGTILVRKRGRNVILQGEVRSALWFECSRCLEGFLYPVEATFRQVLRPPESGRAEAKETELSLEDLEEGIYDEEDIPVESVVVEQLLLSLPMQPLCDKNCKGLCPSCGSNRNLKDCGCHQEMGSPPLDSLKNFVVKNR